MQSSPSDMADCMTSRVWFGRTWNRCSKSDLSRSALITSYITPKQKGAVRSTKVFMVIHVSASKQRRNNPTVAFGGLIFSAMATSLVGCESSPDFEGSDRNAELEIELSSRGDTQVAVTFTNDSDRELGLLGRYVPGKGNSLPMFEITRDGLPVAYEGPIVRFRAPDEEDYVWLGAGESMTAVGSIEDYDLTASGFYTIRYAVAPTQLLFDHEPTMETVTSQELTLELAGRGSQPRVRPRAICSSTRLNTFAQALDDGVDYANNAIGYLDQFAGPRYVRWFGTWNSSRAVQTVEGFEEVWADLFYQTVTPDCDTTSTSCTVDDAYAWVYASDSSTVYLCESFWALPRLGEYSRADTMIHEVSHFDNTANTSDWAYGQAACETLAQSDPVRAVTNADSFAFFAVNALGEF